MIPGVVRSRKDDRMKGRSEKSLNNGRLISSLNRHGKAIIFGFSTSSSVPTLIKTHSKSHIPRRRPLLLLG